MLNEAIPTFVALAIALIGGAGGFAALLKVNADNSKVVSEGAANVVKMLREQIADLDARLESVEQYADAMEQWGEKVSSLLSRAIDAMPEPTREPFRHDANVLGETRPRRNKPRTEGGAP